MQLVTLSWSWCSFTVPKILGPLSVMLNLLNLYFIKGMAKPVWQHICLQHGLLNILSSPSRYTNRTKKIPFEIWLLIDNRFGHQRALMESYITMNVVFYLPIQHPFVAHRSRSIFTFKTDYLKNRFHKAIASIGSDSSDGLGQNKSQIFWKRFTLLDAIKKFCDSWGEVKL